MKNRNIQFKVTSGLLFPLLLVCSAVALALTPTSALPSAEARPSQPISGHFFPCFRYAGPPRPVGENTIITFDVTTTVTGSFTGSSEGTELDIVHRDGSITLFGTTLFNGSLNGRYGTLLLFYTGRGNINTGHETLQFVGGQGTGDLAGVDVVATAEGDIGAPNPGCDASGAGTYTGHVIFGP
jgi:hypothetical protein